MHKFRKKYRTKKSKKKLKSYLNLKIKRDIVTDNAMMERVSKRNGHSEKARRG